MSGRLAGRRILVTGAANGIGAACARRFIAEGARVAGLDRDAAGLAAVAGVVPVLADAADAEAVARAVAAAAAALGGLDGLVCSAGRDLVRPIEAMDVAEWRGVIDLNLTGPMLAARAALAHLRAAGGGTIVTIASGAGLLPLRDRTAYCASKAGLVMFTKALAMEAAADKVRCNVVCPGAVETDMLRGGFGPDEAADRAAVRARYALGRIAEANEIADAVLWLTGGESSFVTGTAVAVDGGRSFH